MTAAGRSFREPVAKADMKISIPRTGKFGHAIATKLVSMAHPGCAA